MSEEKALEAFKNKKNKLLFISVVLDLLGMATYLFPVLGEVGDYFYAPIYGLAIYFMYRKRSLSAIAGGLIGTIEELLPGTDIMPTATIMWIYTYIIKKDST